MTKEENFHFLEQFMIEHQHAYYRLAFSYVKNKDHALDIVQDAITKALRSINSLEEKKYVKTWFYRIIVNTSIDFLRKNNRLTFLEDPALIAQSPTSENDMTQIDLEKAIDSLTPIYKTIIFLRFFEDLKIEEIAMILDMNINTVKTRLYTALKKLRVELGEDYYETTETFKKRI